MYTNRVFGTAKYVLFIEVSLFQGVLNEGFHCTCISTLGLTDIQINVQYIHVHCSLFKAAEVIVNNRILHLSFLYCTSLHTICSTLLYMYTFLYIHVQCTYMYTYVHVLVYTCTCIYVPGYNLLLKNCIAATAIQP